MRNGTRQQRLISPALRGAAKTMAASAIAALYQRGRQIGSGPVAVAGLLCSTEGIGQAARLTLSALSDLGYDTRQIDVCPLFRRDRHVAAAPYRKAAADEGGTLILQLNPPEIAIALARLGRRFVHRRRLIGYWAWELQQVPRWWRAASRVVDGLWAPSEFVARALRERGNTAVRVVHHPVRCPAASGLTRQDFGIPGDAFVCLSALDARSGVDRKNPTAAIRAFRLAFGEDPRHVLLLKVGEPDAAPGAVARLQAEAGGARNVTFLFQKYQAEDVAALMQAADVVLSLHRSEGFGLLLAEAMLLGKPVVATGWSGNTDYMTGRNSVLIDFDLVPVRDSQGIYTQQAQVWAEANVDAAASWLQRLASNRALGANLGATARQDATLFFSLERFQTEIGDMVAC